MVRRAFPEVTLIAARRNLGVVGSSLALRRELARCLRSGRANATFLKACI